MRIAQRKVVLDALTNIRQLEEHWEAVHAALHRARGGGYERASVEADDLLRKLMERQLDEFRKLFMWAITLTDEEQALIKRVAHERFLKDGISVADYLAPWGGPILVKAEEEFREMCREAFGADFDKEPAEVDEDDAEGSAP